MKHAPVGVERHHEPAEHAVADHVFDEEPDQIRDLELDQAVLPAAFINIGIEHRNDDDARARMKLADDLVVGPGRIRILRDEQFGSGDGFACLIARFDLNQISRFEDAGPAGGNVLPVVVAALAAGQPDAAEGPGA